MLTPQNTSLWIVSYKRKEALKHTVDSWMNSFPFEKVNIISNYPQEFDFLDHDNIKVWDNIFRPGWMTGSLAWCWNQCMLNTFLTKDWCIMSQDDVTILPGWNDRVTDKYWTYIAPHGDVVTIQGIKGFEQVGWYDERFRAIGGCEADYLLRILRLYPGMLSAHDDHIWRLRHNDVGLADFFWNSIKEGEILQTRVEHNLSLADVECFQRWNQKWGKNVDLLFLEGDYGREREPGWLEIDWYPAFTRRLRECGRIGPYHYGETY